MPSETTQKFDYSESAVIEANIELYRRIAAKYDCNETCASSLELQRMLDRDVDRIAMALGARSEPIECLDCGAGTGNLTLKMLRKGWSVTAVDVSSEMLAILRDKARRAGYSPQLIHDSFTDFLARCDRSYDVITFSSVLHHVQSYLSGVSIAAEHIAKKGVFYSAFDPVISAHPHAARYFDAFDALLAKLAKDRSDLLAGVGRRLKKGFLRTSGRPRPIVSAGDLAEYHAKTGIDDRAIIEVLKERGFTVVDYSRRAFGRTSAAIRINSHLHLRESCKIMAQRST